MTILILKRFFHYVKVEIRQEDYGTLKIGFMEFFEGFRVSF